MSNQEYLLGNLLVKKKLIDFSQLSKAVEYQSKLNPKDFLPIGEILVKLDFILPEDLEEVLKEQKALRSGITNTSKNNSSVISKNISNTEKSEKISQSEQIQNITLNKPKASVSMSFINKSQKFLESRVKSMEQPPPPPLRNDTISLNNKTYDVTNPVNKAVIQTKIMPEKPKPFKTTLEKENSDLKIKVTEIASKMGLLSKDELFKIIKQSQSVGSKDTSVGELLVQHGFITNDQLKEILKNIK
jgi:hypothetical protein